MKKRMSILFIIAVLGLVFILAGMPMLRYLKEQNPKSFFSEKNESGGSNSDEDVDYQAAGGREVTLDLTIEDICTNPVTGQISLECSSPDSCDTICKNRGCKLFGLNYGRSEYKDNRCYCICYEENRIKKALSQG